MAIRSITLTGTEVSVDKLGGRNVCILNTGTDTVYASAASVVVPHSDGVLPVMAGSSAVLPSCEGTVYILGNSGSVTLVGQDGYENFFKPMSGAGMGEDMTARAAIESHSANAAIHMTADNVCALVSNRNMLINPDLSINQRGQEEYTEDKAYTADRWLLSFKDANTVGGFIPGGNILKSETTGGYAVLRQYIEAPERLSNKTVTLSAALNSVSGRWTVQLWTVSSSGAITSITGPIYSTTTENKVTVTLPQISADVKLAAVVSALDVCELSLQYMKLESGEHATAYDLVNISDEMLRCQRYYQQHDTNTISETELRPSMRATPSITLLPNNCYCYDAEIY